MARWRTNGASFPLLVLYSILQSRCYVSLNFRGTHILDESLSRVKFTASCYRSVIEFCADWHSFILDSLSLIPPQIAGNTFVYSSMLPYNIILKINMDTFTDTRRLILTIRQELACTVYISYSETTTSYVKYSLTWYLRDVSIVMQLQCCVAQQCQTNWSRFHNAYCCLAVPSNSWVRVKQANKVHRRTVRSWVQCWRVQSCTGSLKLVQCCLEFSAGECSHVPDHWS
jgi:hypothetical protein